MKHVPQTLAAKRLQLAGYRASIIIDLMLKEMQAGLKEPNDTVPSRWNALFGEKQSMVSNLQKLVQTLGDLPNAAAQEISPAPELGEQTPLTAQEVKILTAWLGTVANESHGTADR